jgi:Cysteine-rich secretory protein family
MYWRVALLVLLTTSVLQAKAEPPDEQALHLLNHYRQLAGLTPVKLDRKLSAGCMEHANYMLQNQGTDAMVGLNPHTQRSNLPGASAAGAACAKAADLFLGVSDLGVGSTSGWPACTTAAQHPCAKLSWSAWLSVLFPVVTTDLTTSWDADSPTSGWVPGASPLWHGAMGRIFTTAHGGGIA